MKKWSSIFILFLSSTALAWSALCPTKIQCSANTYCTCSPGASTAYARYFYFNVKLQKGFTYECLLKTSIFNSSSLDTISLPKGAEIQEASPPHFPVKLSLTTVNMEKQEEEISIKFLVPPADMADDFQGICKVKNSKIIY